MIVGVGIDLVKNKRIKKLKEKYGERFFSRFFTDKEIKILKDRDYPINSMAGFFAAKEAVSKSMGTGVRDFNLRDIEVTKNELGKPSITLYNNAKNIAEELDITTIHISITHEKEYSIASAIAEKI